SGDTSGMLAAQPPELLRREAQRMRSTFAAAMGMMLVTSISRSQSFVREPLPRAPGARISTITAPGPFSEPGIAIDPRDPRRAVGVYQNQASAAWSADGGATWTTAEGT